MYVYVVCSWRWPDRLSCQSIDSTAGVETRPSRGKKRITMITALLLSVVCWHARTALLLLLCADCLIRKRTRSRRRKIEKPGTNTISPRLIVEIWRRWRRCCLLSYYDSFKTFLLSCARQWAPPAILLLFYYCSTVEVVSTSWLHHDTMTPWRRNDGDVTISSF